MISRRQRVPFADTSKLPADFDLERYKVNGKVVNIFSVLINHPKLLRAWGRFGAYILSNEQTLSPRTRDSDPADRMAQPGAIRMGAARKDRQDLGTER